MSRVYAPREAGRRPPSAGGPSHDRRGHYVTLGLTLWTVLGLYLDVWSHGQSVPESFFSPYHALFYSGFVATAAWMLRPLSDLHTGVPEGWREFPAGTTSAWSAWRSLRSVAWVTWPGTSGTVPRRASRR